MNNQVTTTSLFLPLVLLLSNLPGALAFGAGDTVMLIVGLILGFVCLCAFLGCARSPRAFSTQFCLLTCAAS